MVCEKDGNMLRKILIAFGNLFKLPIIYMPGTLGKRLRYLYYKKRLKRCGKNVVIDEGVIIENPEWISIGNSIWIDKYTILSAGPVAFSKRDILKKKHNRSISNINEGELIIGSGCHIGAFNVLQAYGGIRIGDNVTTSAFVKIYSLSNMPNNPSNLEEITFANCVAEGKVAYIMGPVEIEDGVWIGLDSIILSGVKIGKYSFVRSKSLVISNIEKNSIASGNPAKRIKERFKLKSKNE